MNEHMSDSHGLRGITLAVLAGGAGRRMGGPKSAIRIGGEPILIWLLRHYAWPGPTLLVTAPGTPLPAGAERFELHAVDAAVGRGPLEGVRTALSTASSNTVIIVTVDMPAIKTVHLAWLAERLRKNPARLGVMCRRASGEESIEPFPCALRRGALARVECCLAESRRAARALCDGRLISSVRTPTGWPDEVWLNLNYPHELKAFCNAHLLVEHQQ
jgi:molybdopterin-guanine dinucleotide biosynthesis protein A